MTEESKARLAGDEDGLKKDVRRPNQNTTDNSQERGASQAEVEDISLAVADARIELLIDDIGDNAGAMLSQLNVVLATRDANDTVGLIHSLRRARAYWKAITGSAADLVAVEAQRLSILRQAEEP